jgi:hypothetical protein
MACCYHWRMTFLELILVAALGLFAAFVAFMLLKDRQR